MGVGGPIGILRKFGAGTKKHSKTQHTHTHIRKRTKTDPSRKSAVSDVLRFRVCFGALLAGNKERPKTQHTQKRRFSLSFFSLVFLKNQGETSKTSRIS